MNIHFRSSQLIWRLVLASLIGIVLAHSLVTALMLARSNDNLPPRDTPEPMATSNLPPRETTVPTSIPKSSKKDTQAGASIQLRTKPFRFGLWIGVQWQDSIHNWHDVAGWQGTFNHPDHISWFVEQKDFGKGPFRWVVYQIQGGVQLATSEQFFLPTNTGEVVSTEVVLDNPCLISACNVVDPIVE